MRVLVVAALLLAAWLAVAVPLFVVHHDDRPGRAEAIVVLAGSHTRLPVGVRLMEDGLAPTLVVSLPAKRNALYRRVCGGRPRFRTICFVADPSSTRGEAEEIGRLAALNRWASVEVVTSQFHVFRARLLIRRCFHGRLRMVGAPQSDWRLPLDMAKETAKLAWQLTVQRGC